MYTFPSISPTYSIRSALSSHEQKDNSMHSLVMLVVQYQLFSCVRNIAESEHR